jgi:hypothetical protein
MTNGLTKVLSLTALALCLATVGCGGGDDGGGDPAAFVGMWQYTSGTNNFQCPMLNTNDTSQLQGTKETFAKGVDAPLIYSDASTNCTVKFNISGTTATAPGGQSCMTNLMTANGNFPTTITVTSAVFTVNGTTGHFSSSANFVVNANGTSINCSSTGSGDLMRISM